MLLWKKQNKNITKSALPGAWGTPVVTSASHFGD
jgi:hypothetical protein